ncbi:hypothetical protein H5410_058095 [Solanum commersonii]|uniref:Phosphotyrosine protein phosphatase I domain-containing protein n=1 Tax=Solanum commersonii TaxID=4109 RepID=A0A9J5WQ22_SOLCO|nr:hypothetical protein H5410_058095 [Solanum commersonii]
MRSLLFSTVTIPTPSKLPNCHRSHYAAPHSLKFPFLTFLLPSKYPFLLKESYKSVKIKALMESRMDPSTKPFSVLFVCLGNICRSPAAEGVFTDLVKKRGLDSKFKIDSAGTINYHEFMIDSAGGIDDHEGNEADPRMRAAAKSRGIAITSISRPIRPSDFKDFDLILAMDEQNKSDILGALERWVHREPLPADAAEKVRLMCSYCKKHEETEVPDPYYGGAQGFEKKILEEPHLKRAKVLLQREEFLHGKRSFLKVLDMLEDACDSLLESIVTENKI